MPNHKKWTDDKLAIVEELAKDKGLTARAIFELQIEDLAGFTQRSIQSVMARFGYTDPKRSAQRRRARQLTKEEKECLIAYLKAKGANKSNKAVAKKLRVPLSSVEYWRKKLGQSVDRLKIFRSASYRRRASRRVMGYGKEMREARRSQFRSRRAYLVRRFGKNPDKICRTCKEAWYADTFFFYTATSKKEGRRLYFATCKACISEQRARKKYGV